MPRQPRKKRAPRATKAMVKKTVNSVLNNRLEKKYYSPESGFFEVDGSAAVTLGTVFDMSAAETQMDLSDIAQGDGQGQRIGSEIQLLSWKLNWTDFQSDSSYRLLVVYFPNSDGSNFLAALTSATIGAFGPSKKDYADSYRILYDRWHKFDSSEQVPSFRRISLPVKGLKVNYDDDATTLISGAVKFYILTNATTAGGVMGDINGVSKMIYIDA